MDEVLSLEFSKEDLDRKISLKPGDLAPLFSLEDSSGKIVKLEDFRGKNVILYFYPKDNTPGCSTEACEFSKAYDEFIDHDSVIIGISPDSPASHLSFAKKFGLRHILLSDPDKEVSKAYGSWQVRKNYGKTYLGIVRSTFFINKDGLIAKVYKSVRPQGHASKVLEDIKKL